MTDGELATYFARAGKPEQWYKVHRDEAGAGGAGGDAPATAGSGYGDDVLRLSPRAVSLYSHNDVLSTLPAGPVAHPRDTLHGLREVDATGAPRPIVNMLATTVEVVKAATDAGAERARNVAAADSDAAAASPQPYMRTSDGGLLPDNDDVKRQASSASRRGRAGESGTGGTPADGPAGDATDALLHPALSSKMLESAENVRAVAQAQRALDDDIVHVDDAESIRPPPPAAAGAGAGTPAASPAVPVGPTPAFLRDAVAASETASRGSGGGADDSTPASSVSESTAIASSLWANGECGVSARSAAYEPRPATSPIPFVA
jgi:hypothetical protein